MLTSTRIEDDLIFFDYGVRSDNRGFLIKPFINSEFERYRLDPHEMFYSTSEPGVIRGMHYQSECSKLVFVIGPGSIRDVVLNINPGSIDYGRAYSFELKESQGILIGPHYAHGFQVLGKLPATVGYITNQEYDPAEEGGIRWDSFGFKWDNQKQSPIISERDLNLPEFSSL